VLYAAINIRKFSDLQTLRRLLLTPRFNLMRDEHYWEIIAMDVFGLLNPVTLAIAAPDASTSSNA
jgi:hypothetical protein